MLYVTAIMIHGLYDTAMKLNDIRDEAVLSLAPSGWDVEVVRHGGAEHESMRPLIALTGEDVYQAADTDDDTEGAALDDVLADAFASNGGDHFRICHASGSAEPPAEGVKWAVVTGEFTGSAPAGATINWDPADVTRDWAKATWTDIGAAREAVSAPYSNSATRQASLWTTPEGSGYLLKLTSQWTGEFEEEWVSISPDDALLLAYGADDEDVEEGLNHDPLLAAARHARALADALSVAEDADFAAAARAFGASRTMSDFLRTRLASTLRDTRGTAGRAVIAELGGDRQAAADHLDVSYPTLSNLI
ncbi:hypothetical protein ACFC7A_31650 [Streptomyces niveus]|uniref:hypothetical protein n=1 Tax=Streptomyces niveus TaxID=193462 RepID=UPI0035DDE6D4